MVRPPTHSVVKTYRIGVTHNGFRVDFYLEDQLQSNVQSFIMTGRDSKIIIETKFEKSCASYREFNTRKIKRTNLDSNFFGKIVFCYHCESGEYP